MVGIAAEVLGDADEAQLALLAQPLQHRQRAHKHGVVVCEGDAMHVVDIHRVGMQAL